MKRLSYYLTKIQKKEIAQRASSFAISGLLLLLVLFTLLSGSLGWFASNRNVDGSGIDLSLNVPANLIISDNTAEIIKTDINSINDGSPFAITIQTNENSYLPAVHDTNSEAYPTGLKYVTNHSNIDLTTGTGAGFLYADAQNTVNQLFYTDYTVYIASHGLAFTDATLKLIISSAVKGTAGETTAITSGSLMATSVDVYINTVSSANYAGTLNVAGLNCAVNDYPGTYDASALQSEIYLVGSPATTGTIPCNTDGYLTYVLRCYFDGALQSGAGQTYINTSSLDLSAISLGIGFIATGTEAEN